MRGLRKEARYRASFLNPRTGADLDAGPVTADAEGKLAVPRKPSREDWVLVLEQSAARHA